MLDLCWTMWHWDSFFQVLQFSLIIIILPMLHLCIFQFICHHSYVILASDSIVK